MQRCYLLLLSLLNTTSAKATPHDQRQHELLGGCALPGLQTLREEVQRLCARHHEIGETPCHKHCCGDCSYGK